MYEDKAPISIASAEMLAQHDKFQGLAGCGADHSGMPRGRAIATRHWPEEGSYIILQISAGEQIQLKDILQD